MSINEKNIDIENLQPFSLSFLNSDEEYSVIGCGDIGGKARGLVFISEKLKQNISFNEFPDLEIKIPKFIVIRSKVFEQFMERNQLYEIALSTDSDILKVLAFQKASLPTEILGDLRLLIQNCHFPLAVRSSSILEDKLEEPFAGTYTTKMISNNQPGVDVRFQKLVEAIKFVYASTFFRKSLNYFQGTKQDVKEERMAVIIQSVVGTERTKRFYPTISGVAKSYNYYAFGSSKPEDGVINLALGLGKTIVDGGISWSYVPARPRANMPFADPKDMAVNTQKSFWAVNMNPISNYDPTKENEYLISLNLSDAEYDKTLNLTASTFDAVQNKMIMGVANEGARVINFAPLLKLNEFNFNKLIPQLLKMGEDAYKNPVEIEFALDINTVKKENKFGFLQVRPMNVSKEIVEITKDELEQKNILVKSAKVLGNGIKEGIKDVIFVDPEKFETKYTEQIASEIEEINKELLNSKTPYLLIGFGRWGSSDPWLGIPVDFGQIAGAHIIVESTLPGINVDFSQGSHFFHNIMAFKLFYFSVHHELDDEINWDWLKSQNINYKKNFVKHIKLNKPLSIKVNGRTGEGIITYA